MCVRKPIVATTGLDRSVRVWNYADNTLENCMFFSEEALSISLHPSGLHAVVGFADKLRLLNILMDSIRVVKDFPVRGCVECRFSSGGHLFAAAQSNVVSLFSTYGRKKKEKKGKKRKRGEKLLKVAKVRTRKKFSFF